MLVTQNLRQTQVAAAKIKNNFEEAERKLIDEKRGVARDARFCAHFFRLLASLS